MDYLLELPWWITLAGLGMAIGVWIYGNNRLQKKIKLVGVGLFLLTIIFTLISRAIDTPREQAVERTHEIVSAVDAQEWEKFQSLLNSTTMIGQTRGAAEIRRIVEQGWNRAGFKRAKIIHAESVRSGDLITVYITIFSEGAVPGRSEWQLDYERRREGLLLARARVTGMDGGSGGAEMVMRQFSR